MEKEKGTWICKTSRYKGKTLTIPFYLCLIMCKASLNRIIQVVFGQIYFKLMSKKWFTKAGKEARTKAKSTAQASESILPPYFIV